MPTQRARHMITESDELSASLDKAAERWPDCKSRTELLRLLIAEGSKALLLKADNVKMQREAALQSLQKIGNGLWPADFDAQRNSEWQK
ncbi:MAG: hypothetical protein WCG32_00260 [Actinomycetes bacterium]